ncbi:MAG: N-acetylmuramoyl-L-alanine amidase [Planctomycetia bacterium]|nr:N-acetylmuramoyl-L-alanine amidase [Planctomycetia bacterium]
MKHPLRTMIGRGICGYALIVGFLSGAIMATHCAAQSSENAPGLPELPNFWKNTVSVYLSPSTQERNFGDGEYGTEERRMNEICDQVEKRLKSHGVTVYRNRPEMTLRELVAESNEKKVDVHFAIHSNAFNGKVRGTECFCYRFGGEGERLARKVNEQICAIYDGPRRGVKESADHFGKGKPLYETANTTAPAALVEIAFHDQPEDATWILEHRVEIGDRLAAALILHLAEEHPEAVRP